MSITNNCSVKGCERPPVNIRGYCNKHYLRWKKHGDPLRTDKPRLMTERHGMWRTPTYSSWANMVDRCNNPNRPRYNLYGGRGIKVCDKWRKSFLAFYADMGERPPNTSINRIDNDGNYEPTNCEWATEKIQSINRGLRSDNTSGVKGVGWYKSRNKWIAHIYINKKAIKLGYFERKEDAIEARKKAEAKYFAPLLNTH